MDKEIRRETADVFCELCNTTSFSKGNLLVIDGSSSEIHGGLIRQDNSYEIGPIEEVSVVPWFYAGGAIATNAYTDFSHPAVVGSI